MRISHAIAASALALGLAAPAGAGQKATLNQVWSRLADVNGEAGSVETAQFSPDSRYIISGTKFDYTVIKWRVSDGAEIWRITLPQEVEKVVWTRDGKYVASISEDFVLRLIDANNGRIVREIKHDEGIDSVEVSHNGQWLVTGQEDTRNPDGTRSGWVRIFSLPNLKEVTRFDHGETINESDFSPDDQYLITAGDNSEARLWRTSDWSLVRTFRPDDDEVRDGFVTTRFSPDGTMVAVSGFGGDIHVWRIADGDRVRRWNHTGRKVETLNWSPDGRFLLAAGHDDAIRMYSVSDIANEAIGGDALPVIRVPVSDSMEFVQFNRLGSLVVSSHQDGTIQLWTYMSDDPDINSRRHEEVKRLQEEAAKQRAAQPRK